MPRMRCPGCKRILKIDESNRGDVVACPKCDRRFAVPRSAEDDEPLDQPEAYGVTEEPESPNAAPRYIPEDVDEEEDDDRPVRRKRRRRRRGSELPDFLARWNLDKAILVGVVGLGLVLFGLGLIHPAFLVGLFGGGFVLVGVARVWALVAAVGEGDGMGCLTFFYPWYGLFNLEDRRPLFLFAVGIVYILAGLAVLSILNATGRLN